MAVNWVLNNQHGHTNLLTVLAGHIMINFCVCMLTLTSDVNKRSFRMGYMPKYNVKDVMPSMFASLAFLLYLSFIHYRTF